MAPLASRGREVEAIVRAPGLLAAPRGFGHHPAQQGQVASLAGHAIVERARAGPGAEDGPHALEACALAQDPHLLPHHRPYRVAGGQESAHGPIRSQLLNVGRRRCPHGASGQGTGHAVPEDDTLEQRIAGEPVGAVDARARGLAAGEQPRDRGPAPEVGPDPAHHVVSGRRHRDGLALRRAAVARAVGVDRREPAPGLAGRAIGGVQPPPAASPTASASRAAPPASRTPRHAPPSTISSVMSVRSYTSMPRWRTARARARSMWRPVASPPAWSTRATVWAPSRAWASPPFSGSKWTPRRIGWATRSAAALGRAGPAP